MSAGGEFLGVGWAFPVQFAGDTELGVRVVMAAHEDRVRDSIWIILGTAKGERRMRPDFGCGIHDLVFGLGDPHTTSAVGDAVREALLLWEPRIDLLDVQVESRPGDPATLLIGIEYRVRATNNRFNVVYPFYLDRSSV